MRGRRICKKVVAAGLRALGHAKRGGAVDSLVVRNCGADAALRGRDGI